MGFAATSSRVTAWAGVASTDAGPRSTITPRSMMSIRSASPATSARSWETSRIAVPSCSRRDRNSSATSACTVTSRALVASSASSSSARSATARAMTTRCASPPLSWCGYRSRSAGSRRTASRAWSRRAFRSARGTLCSASARSSQTRACSVGVSDARAAWGTRAMRRPRRSRSSRPSGPWGPTSSTPSKRMEPVTRAFAGCSPITVERTMDLPAPDSPTRPTISPRPTASSATSTRRRPPISTARLRISSNAPLTGVPAPSGQAARAAPRPGA